MFVMRMIEQVKKGCTNELFEFFESWSEYAPVPPHGWRIYQPTQFSPWDVVVMEAEFESLAEHETWWEKFWASPGAANWMERRRELTERGGHGELWRVKAMKKEGIHE